MKGCLARGPLRPTSPTHPADRDRSDRNRERYEKRKKTVMWGELVRESRQGVSKHCMLPIFDRICILPQGGIKPLPCHDPISLVLQPKRHIDITVMMRLLLPSSVSTYSRMPRLLRGWRSQRLLAEVTSKASQPSWPAGTDCISSSTSSGSLSTRRETRVQERDQVRHS